jgi:hypothetical protein
MAAMVPPHSLDSFAPPPAVDHRAGTLSAHHARELAILLELSGGNAVLAGLAAGRTVAVALALDGDAPAADDASGRLDPPTPPSWRTLLAPAAAAEKPPSALDLRAAWSQLRIYQPDAPAVVSDAVLAQLGELWPLLGPAEYLLGTGGDTRLMLDPLTGLNAYGCSPRPRPWAVTFASSTASSISARGYGRAEEARLRLLHEAITHGPAAAAHAATERVRQSLAAHYGLPQGTRIALIPSGTDGELAALSVAALAEPGSEIVNVIAAADETGTGVPLAASAHHFAVVTARGVSITKGDAIAGFPRTTLVEVNVRDEAGALRPPADVDRDWLRAVEDALGRGARVLCHVMDQSKTGLVAPGPDAIARLCDKPRVDIVVDACQARLSAASVRRYIDRGHMVLVTGSKFFTGPPFAGALLLPPLMGARLDGDAALPEGLAAYFSCSEWPDAPAVRAALPVGSSVGLTLRWEAALGEMKAFEAVPLETVKSSLERFGAAVTRAMHANPDLVLHDAPPLARPDDSAEWDAIRTIFAFSVRAPARREANATGERPLLGPEDAAKVHAWLNSDLSSCLAGASDAERALGSRLFHVGQPIPMKSGGGKKIGAMRLSAGARLVSGEPSHAGLAHSTRIENELADALALLDKVSLILRHFEVIAAASPRPRFRGGAS